MVLSHHPRNSNIEMGRIISMFLIVLGHYSWQTPWNYNHLSSISTVLIQALWIGGKLGVDIFVLISSYFLYTSNRLPIKPFVKLWKQVFFFSFIISFVLIVFFKVTPSPKIVLKTLFPFSTGAYWFFTAYGIMLLLSPFMNIMLRNLSKQQFHWLLGTLTVFFILANVTQVSSFGMIEDTGMTLITIYPFGAYIRRYKNDLLKIGNTKLVLIGTLSSIILLCSAMFIDLVQRLLPTILSGPHAYARLYGPTSPLQLCTAVVIFCLLLKRPALTNTKINYVAQNVFGVYLFHCHPLLIGPLWVSIVAATRFENSPLLLLGYGLVVSIIIFCIGVSIDRVRIILGQLVAHIFHKLHSDKNTPV